MKMKSKNGRRHPELMAPSLLDEGSTSREAQQSQNINFILIQRFQYWDYLMEHEGPYELQDQRRISARKDQLGLARKYLHKLIDLARCDGKNLERNLRHLNKISTSVRLIVDYGAVQFDGLTQVQMRECSEMRELAVSPHALHTAFGVPWKTMDNGMSLFKTQGNAHWAYLMSKGGKQILVRTIPQASLKKYNIPLEVSDIIKKIDFVKDGDTEKAEGEQLNVLNSALQKFYTKEWPFLVDNYKHLNFKMRGIHARAESALHFVTRKISEGFSWDILHEVMKMNCVSKKDHTKRKNNDGTLKLLFNPGSTVKYFEKKISNGIKEGFSKILVHGNHGKPSKKKTPEEARELVIAKITNDRVFNLTKIADDIEKETKYKVSYRTVRRIYKQNSELATAASKGLEDYEINRAPYFKSSGKPAHIGDYAEADGTRYGFVSKDKFGQIIFERGYSILDGHSGRSTGCIGQSENEDLVLGTFKIFVKRFGFLHREIRHDGASAHTSEKFEKFKELSSNMGVVWRPSETSTDLSLVERSHSTFITRIGNGKEFFIGEGLKSKRKRARPSPERIALYREAGDLITQEELHRLFYSNEEEFNNDVIKGKKKNKLSAKMKWDRSTPENAVKVDAVDFIRLFGEKKEPTVQKGVITFTTDATDGGAHSQEYSYSIYTKDLLYKVNFQKVIVRFDPSDMGRAYLFSLADDEFLSTVYPSPAGEKAKFAQTTQGKKNLKIHCDQKKKLMDGIEEDIEHYKRVNKRHEESKIPADVVSPHDKKDLSDQANLDYFLEATKNVDRVTEAKR